jgi:hypothetical protein
VDAEEEGEDGHEGEEEEEVGEVVVALEDVVTSDLELKPTAAIVILAVMSRTMHHSTMPSLKNTTSLRLTICKIRSH